MKESNTHLLATGAVKVREGLKIFETIEQRDHEKRKVQVSHNTWIYTKCATDEEAIEKYKKRYGIV